MVWSPFVGLPFAIALLALLLIKLLSFKLLPTHSPLPRIFTAEEISLYNGSNPQLPIYLGILGSVFDVTKGKSHYGEGGGYSHFSGRMLLGRLYLEILQVDLSQGMDLLTRCLVCLAQSFVATYEGMSSLMYSCGYSLFALISVVKSVVEWRDFYFRTYIYVGKLAGRYYDNKGNPTKYLKGVEAKAARGAQLLEKQKIEEEKVPSCNSRWSQDDGSEVWCDEGYPRLVQRPLEIALTGKMSKRCACYKEDELGEAGLEVYAGCDYLAQKCRL